MICCPHCSQPINPGSLLGRITSPAKANAARLNGKRGGNPQLIGKVRKEAASAPVMPSQPMVRQERAPLFKSNGKLV